MRIVVTAVSTAAFLANLGLVILGWCAIDIRDRFPEPWLVNLGILVLCILLGIPSLEFGQERAVEIGTWRSRVCGFFWLLGMLSFLWFLFSLFYLETHLLHSAAVEFRDGAWVLFAHGHVVRPLHAAEAPLFRGYEVAWMASVWLFLFGILEGLAWSLWIRKPVGATIKRESK